MTCEKCPACGLVLDNHDFSMVIKCAQDLCMPSLHEVALKFLRDYKK